jgi:hypothetical protein
MPAENPRVPVQGLSEQGKPVPKMRANAVIDGNQVNIPGPAKCDGAKILLSLIGLLIAVFSSQEIALAIRPYPKPTQVDW